MPVLFAGGIILATAFSAHTTTEVWKIVTKVKANASKLNWLRPNFLEPFSSGAIGLGLLTLGIFMLVGLAFLEAFLGFSFAVKIGFIVSGTIFFTKGISNYILTKSNEKAKAFLGNL